MSDSSSRPLIQVSKDVYTLIPPSNVEQVPTDAPRVILLFGWMDGKVNTIAKYMDKYSELYPSASQILVLSKQSASWTSRRKRVKALRPVVEFMKSHGFFSAHPPDVLVHVFSNGGGFQLVLLAEMLREVPRDVTIQNASRPALCFVFDSVPGNAGLFSALRAFTMPLRSMWLKALITIPLTILYFIVMGGAFLTRTPPPFKHLRAGLKEAQLLPWSDEKTPRVYIYSKEDQIVEYEAVEEHIATVRQKGFDASVELFEGSKHVAHGRMFPERYWDIIRRTWRDALKVKSAHSSQ